MNMKNNFKNLPSIEEVETKEEIEQAKSLLAAHIDGDTSVVETLVDLIDKLDLDYSKEFLTKVARMRDLDDRIYEAIAYRGVALFALSNKSNAMVRQAVALMCSRDHLDKFVNDLVKDPSVDVRYVIALRGFADEKLVDDCDASVRDAVANRRVLFKTLIDNMRSRHGK